MIRSFKAFARRSQNSVLFGVGGGGGEGWGGIVGGGSRLVALRFFSSRSAVLAP